MITPFDVRVLIEPTAPREHVIAHLRNILAQIESGIDVLTIRAEGRAARANAEWDDLPAFDRETLKPEERD